MDENIQIYTDGSKRGAGTRAAFFFCDHDNNQCSIASNSMSKTLYSTWDPDYTNIEGSEKLAPLARLSISTDSNHTAPSTVV